MHSDFAVKPLGQSSWSEICVISEALYHEEKRHSEIDSSEVSQKSHQWPMLATIERLTCYEVKRNIIFAESCADEAG